MQLIDKIKAIHPAITDEEFYSGKIILKNDGGVDYIAEWNSGAFERPSEDQLAAIKSFPVSYYQNIQLDSVNKSYQAAVQNDVEYTSIGGVTKVFQCDTFSQSRVQAAINGFQKLLAVPDGFAWIAADNTPVPFTYADLLGLAEVMYAHEYDAFVKLQQLKTEIRSANTADQVLAVAW